MKAHPQNIQKHGFNAMSPLALWNLLPSLLSFRLEMPVTEVMAFSSDLYGETGYYVCPRCATTMEREFMTFCDRCGQKLGWKDCENAKVIYPGQHNATHGRHT